MIIASYDADVLEQAFGIDMSGVEGLGTGAGWGRVAPGRAADRHQHDETELFVIVSGSGEFVLDSGERHPAEPGTVVLFEPFETHVLANTGANDLVFFTQYWRDGDRALASAANPARKGFGERPVFVFSTPPTPNGDLHLGHLSGPYLGADAFTRFQRMTGAEAYHLTGSDDYQSYVVGAARKDGRTPAETAAHYSAEIAETLRLMDIPLDQYTVTDQDGTYREGLQDFFSRVVDSGQIAVTAHDALYDAESGQYLYEVDVKGGCPGCGTATSGNICEECGEPNTVADLTDPVSAASTQAPRRAPAARWTLPLHAFADDVRAHHRLGRVPARLRELADRLFRRPALDIPVTHPSTWGVEPQENATEGQVIWVWPEMSYGFLHGIQSLGSRLGRDWRAADPAQDWKIVHFFGYDNSFYHAVLYPVLYRLAFPGWTPDIDYHVNEFYLLEGSKFSTSRRHAVWGKEILTPDTVDSVRYFLAATRPEGRRTDFRRAAYEATLDDTLIGTWQQWLNDLGARVAKHHGGHAPDAGNWTPNTPPSSPGSAPASPPSPERWTTTRSPSTRPPPNSTASSATPSASPAAKASSPTPKPGRTRTAPPSPSNWPPPASSRTPPPPSCPASPTSWPPPSVSKRRARGPVPSNSSRPAAPSPSPTPCSSAPPARSRPRTCSPRG
ncbi:class I tRNA ligase family protein [Streptomyces cirratus]|uniref:class I tRNA ligase family protein n=1 Tax=Streptomyces cirratus TaxID=68187 RepID=UPI00361149AC